MKFRPKQCPICEYYHDPHLCFNPFPSKYYDPDRPVGWVATQSIAKRKCSRFKKKED